MSASRPGECLLKHTLENKFTVEGEDTQEFDQQYTHPPVGASWVHCDTAMSALSHNALAPSPAPETNLATPHTAGLQAGP